MMGRALLIIGFLATLGLIATGALGYGLHGPADDHMSTHMLVGLAASLLLLFAHCWIMFFLIGTGTAIKEAVNENGLDSQFIEDTKRFKNRSYPMLMLALGLVIATCILGGAVATGSLRWLGGSVATGNLLHHVLSYATLAAQLRALQLEWQVLTENERLMGNINRLLAGPPAVPQT
jgi:4-hydroxybenzoate polyprenyltransferase